jgi:hypothetical protein
MLSEHEENIMAKLTDAQLIVLSSAVARDDGTAVVPARMNRAAASKVGASRVTRKLMREVRSKPGMPVWWKGEDDRPISLMITRAGRDAIGVGKNGLAETLRPSNKQSEEKDAPTLEKRSRDASGVETRKCTNCPVRVNDRRTDYFAGGAAGALALRTT